MAQLKQVFAPLIGQLVWGVRRTYGSFITLEFGTPHLSVREPIGAIPTASAKVRRNLSRRRVFVTGDWHLWVQYGDWKISTTGGVLGSNDPWDSPQDECLHDLDGQRLLSVCAGNLLNSSILNFDMGGTIEIWPSIEIPDDQWCLYSWNGDIVARRDDGTFVSEKTRAGDSP